MGFIFCSTMSKKFTKNNIFISDETLIFIDYNTLLLAVVLSRIIVSCDLTVCMYQSIKRHLFSLEWRIEARYDVTLSTWYHDSYYTLYITNDISRENAMISMLRWDFIQTWKIASLEESRDNLDLVFYQFHSHVWMTNLGCM